MNHYIHITKEWSDDIIDVFFPSKVRCEALFDQPELVSFVDGPIVLAGLTEQDTGIVLDTNHTEEFLFPRTEHTYSTFTWSQNEYVTRNQEKNFRLIPLYDILDETYTVYFSCLSKVSAT